MAVCITVPLERHGCTCIVLSTDLGGMGCSHPPVCVPSFLPFTVTVVCQSTAPKCSRILESSQSDGSVKVRLYHMRAVLLSALNTPACQEQTHVRADWS